MNFTLKIIALSASICFSLLSNAFAHGDKSEDSHSSPAGQSEVSAQYLIRVESGFRIEGPSVIKLKRGEQVELDFISDSADELHLHGYDITVVLEPNKVARLSFKAKYAGRFSFELHETDREIGAFEVSP
jgi:hypothetical protein